MPGLKRAPAPPPPRMGRRASPVRPSHHHYAEISGPPPGKPRKGKKLRPPPPAQEKMVPVARLRRSSDLSDVILYALPGSERGRARRWGSRGDVLMWRERQQRQQQSLPRRRARSSSLPASSKPSKGEPWWLSRMGIHPARSRSLSRSNMPLVAMAAARRRSRVSRLC